MGKVDYSKSVTTTCLSYCCEVKVGQYVIVHAGFAISVRSKDRVSALSYARQLADLRNSQGFKSREVLDALETLGDFIRKRLYKEEELHGMEQEIYDEIEGRFEEIQRANILLDIKIG